MDANKQINNIFITDRKKLLKFFVQCYFPKGQTINTEYYSSLLVQLKDIWKEKHHGKITKAVLILHENALAHRALAIQKKLVSSVLITQPILHIWPRRTSTCSLD